VKPDFDEIVGSDAEDAERLRQVHELLVLAGPPPELTPRLSRTPDVAGGGNVVALPRIPVTRRTTVLIAAAVAVLAIFGGGYAFGHAQGTTKGSAPLSVLPLRGTARAPRASASLEIYALRAGNWPMTLTVSNLPKLPAHAYYEVYLVRNGKPYLSCGEFTVAGGSKPVTVQLNAPYVFRHGDTWVVTKQLPGHETPGPEILRPAV
jgi:hypothetical protein